MAKKYTPPANKEIKQWVAKIALEEDRGNDDEAIRLLDGAIGNLKRYHRFLVNEEKKNAGQKRRRVRV